MTSVPKPLKFLRPHYHELEAIYSKWPSSDDKVSYFTRSFLMAFKFSHQSLFADILGVLAMTYSDTRPRETLKYRLLSNKMSSNPSPPGLWGHEYIRHLSAELGAEFLIRQEADLSSEQLSEDATGGIKELRELGVVCATFLLEHNAEADAVDLLEELECVEKITHLVDKDTYARVCQYMVR